MDKWTAQDEEKLVRLRHEVAVLLSKREDAVQALADLLQQLGARNDDGSPELEDFIDHATKVRAALEPFDETVPRMEVTFTDMRKEPPRAPPAPPLDNAY